MFLLRWISQESLLSMPTHNARETHCLSRLLFIKRRGIAVRRRRKGAKDDCGPNGGGGGGGCGARVEWME